MKKRSANGIEELQLTNETLKKELEQKNRELEIEAALEQLRARSSAMHKSNELKDVVRALYKEFRILVADIDSVNIQLNPDSSKDIHYWASVEKDIYPELYHVPYSDLPIFEKVYNAFHSPRDEFFHYSLNKEEKDAFFREIFKVQPVPLKRKKLIQDAEGMVMMGWFHKHSGIDILRYNLQRFSEEEKKIVQRFAATFEQTYTRFLDLQKAEAQAREAQIEAALEKIRSRSLAMHKSDELQDLVNAVFDQLKELHIDMNSASIFIFEEGSKDWQQWVAAPETSYATYFHIPYSNQQIVTDLEKARETGKDFFTVKYSFEEKNNWFDYAFEHTDYRKIPEKRKNYIRKGECMVISYALSKNTGIQITKYHGEKFSDEENEILRRIVKVFEQAYVRFLDLKKAEAQAREAEIQLALEHVRAQSMAMHKSEDLAEVVGQIKEEIMGLGIEIYNAQITTDFTSDPNDGMNVWISAEGRQYLEKFHIPFIDHPLTTKFYNTLKNDLGSFTKRFSKSEKNAYFKLLFEHSDFKDIPEERKNFVLNSPGWVICWVILKNSMMEFARFNLEKFNREEIDVFKLFGKVFEQAYTRFLDLQKAEAQAREAQIEASLERLRARSMAMHHSRELVEVVRLLDKEIKGLGIQFVDATQIVTDFSNPEEGLNTWITVRGMYDPEKYHVPYFDHPLMFNLSEALKKGQNFYTVKYLKAEKNRFYRLLFKYSDFGRITKERQAVVLDAPGLVESFVIHKNSALLFMHYGLNEFSAEDNAIFRRFGAVFEQAYTRFLDLQKAEAQARESEIQLALERVRASTMAMHKSNELAETAAILFQQMTELGVTPERINICLIKEADNILEVWATDQQGVKISHHFNASLDEPTTGKPVYDAWKEKKKSIIIDLSGKELNDWIRYVREVMGMTIKAELVKEHRIHSVAFFSQGMILTTTPEPLPEESITLLERFADVFNLTYRRFLDLQKAETQARDAQIEAALERVRSLALGHEKK